jgi:hypothetical protein
MGYTALRHWSDCLTTGLAQRFSRSFSNLRGAGQLNKTLTRSGPRRRALPFMAGLVALTISGCALQQSWDDYASTTETLKLSTFIQCGSLFVSPVPEHQEYFHIVAMAPNADGSYRVEYQQQSKRAVERLYVRSVQFVGLQKFTAIPTVYWVSETNARCIALLVLPWSSLSERPFYYPREAPLRAATEQNLQNSAVINLAVLIVMVLLFHFAMQGFLEGEHAVGCVTVFVSVVLLNAGVWWLNSLTLINIDALTTFYRFYDALPKSGGALLPLAWSQADKLFAGPPPPASFAIDNQLWLTALAGSCGVWLLAFVRRICVGIRYEMMPDPFEQVRREREGEGRTPTPEDYLDALSQAAMGTSAEELQLLKRKMKERIPDA